MIKIWAKLYCEDKIQKSIMFSKEGKLIKGDLHKYIYEICGELDVPSPVVLKTHEKNFFEFNVAKFRASDFLETIYFDYMTLENC